MKCPDCGRELVPIRRATNFEYKMLSRTYCSLTNCRQTMNILSRGCFNKEDMPYVIKGTIDEMVEATTTKDIILDKIKNEAKVKEVYVVDYYIYEHK